MTQELFSQIFSQWKKRELLYQKKKKRKYLHFDKYIQFHKNIQWFKSYLNNAIKNIPKHSFYPFIKSDIITPKIKHEKDFTGRKKIVKGKKIRPISYASHFDSFIYSWYANVLTFLYQSQLKTWGIEDCVLAYLEKDKKNNIDFAFEVFNFIRSKEDCVVLTFDLKSFFDYIDHERLKKQWCSVLKLDRLPKDHFKIYQNLTNYSFIYKEYLDIRFPKPLGKKLYIDRICTPIEFREMVNNGQVIQKNPFINSIRNSKRFGETCGIPQGSPISACLSNIYLKEFDQLVNAFAKRENALYRRYCDDILIVCSVKNVDFFNRLIKRSILKCEVEINETKTEKIYFKQVNGKLNSFNEKNKNKHLQYLGFEFNGENIYIRSSSMSRYFRRVNSKIKQAIDDAYCSDFGQQDFIFRKKLFTRYSNFGKRNFISYGYKAKQKMENSKTIHKQIKNSIIKIERLISSKKREVEVKLENQKKIFIEKK